MSKLEESINGAIYTFPSLYRCDNHFNSRMKVLNQMFFTIGNGYEWNDQGELVMHSRKSFEIKELPVEFYSKRLFSVDAKTDFDFVLSKLEGRYFYISKNTQIIFEMLPSDIIKPFSFHKMEYWMDSAFLGKDLFITEALANWEHPPYQLSDYSALVEIYNEEVKPSAIYLNAALEAATFYKMCYENGVYKNMCPYSFHPSNEEKEIWEKTQISQIELLSNILAKLSKEVK